MPTYTFRNKETGEEQDYVMSIHDHDDFKKNHPELEQVLFPIATLSRYHGTNGTNLKPAEGFREVLRGIKDNHKGSTVDSF